MLLRAKENIRGQAHLIASNRPDLPMDMIDLIAIIDPIASLIIVLITSNIVTHICPVGVVG